MKVDMTYANYLWKERGLEIIERNMDKSRSPLIVRESDPEIEWQIMELFANQKKYLLFRLSESCQLSNLVQEIILRLELPVQFKDTQKRFNLRKLKKALGSNKTTYSTIVIDNLHRIPKMQLFTVVRVIQEFHNHFNFAFLMPETYFKKWFTEDTDRHLKFFLELIAGIYIVGLGNEYEL